MNIWQMITRFGVTASMPLHLQDRTRFANSLGLIVAMTGIFLISVYTYLGRSNMQPLIGMTCFGFVVPILNRLRAGLLVRILLSLAPAVTVTFFDIALKNNPNTRENLEIISYITPRYVALSSIMLPLVLFTHRERWVRNILVVLLLLLVFNFDTLFHLAGVHFTKIKPELSSKAYNLQWINMAIVMATLLTTTSFLMHSNRKSEENNQQILAEALATNLRLQESETRLKESLDAIKESKKELEQKSYVSAGLAHFLQLLRREKDFDKLTHLLLSELANYLNVQQGALYWHSSPKNESILELIALYALPQEKVQQSTFFMAEGVVGACFSQKKVIHITKVADTHTQILSGLGAGKAREVIFVPLLADETAIGVIELATFYQIASYQIDLLEQVAEATAVSLLNIQNAKRSEKMLAEFQQLKQSTTSAS